ncbi:MAG: cyclic nucleotide-binding domain-containing protein [Myxococcales bacterium]|nr:cyclic nucleotide-binding domain-containing protein [Myxococcales bacterium]
MRTVQELREYADRCLFAGDFERALHGYAALVRIQPHDLDARQRIGDGLLALEAVQEAAQVYTALARHAALGGYPLRALVALKILERLEPQLSQLQDAVARLYSLGSEKLGRGVRLSLADHRVALPEIDLSATPSREALIRAAAMIGTDTSSIAVYPEQLPPIPLFSELPAEAFSAVLRALKLRRTRPEEAIIEQGEAGHSFFVIARGSVKITRLSQEGPEIELATLHEGSLFGEMALVSAEPRSATVRAEQDADLLEFDRSALQAAASEVSTIAAALDRFTRERLLNNLMATSPLFRPLEREQRLDLMRRFSAHEVGAGTPIIREGETGLGLYVLLSGEVEVFKTEGDDRIPLATLHGGDVFGEISLITDEPTTASVSAISNSTVLFLAREFFQKLITAVESIRDYVEDLGEERMMDTRLTIADGGDLSIEIDVDEDELLLI